MSDVFLSYKSNDRDAVGRLVRALEQDGLNVWWDQHIEADAAWEETIERELAAAKAVVVCWSSASVSSDNVKAEARKARKEGRLLQTFFDDCEPPLFFGERQGVNLRGWNGERRERNYQMLLEGVRSVVAGKRASAAVGYVPKRTPLLPLIVVASVAATLAVAGVVVFGSMNRPLTPATPSASELLARIFDPRPTEGAAILGGDIRYLETLTGPPTASYEVGDGTTEYTYRVGPCEIRANVARSESAQTSNASSISELTLLTQSLVDGAYVDNPECSFDIAPYFALEAPLPANSTVGEIEARLATQSYFTTDCPYLDGCGNSYDPQTYFIATGPHALQFASVEVAFFPLDNRTWLSAIAAEKGDAFLGDQFLCDPSNNSAYDLALSSFRDERPFSVTVGYNFPYPGPIHQSRAC